jgi:hypothetical protein
MNDFTITSRPVTKNIITIEMDEDLARKVMLSIHTDLLDYGMTYDPKDVEYMQNLADAIRGHLSQETK